MQRDDLRTLRGAAGVLGLCLAVSSLLVGTSHWFWREADREYREHFQRFRAASERYLAIDEDERIITEQYPRFRELMAEGIIGVERRLDWVETLRQADATLGLPGLEYRIAAQQAVEPEFPLDTGRFELRASDMELELGLLHEEDLARLLDFIVSRGHGLPSVEECELRRESETVSASSVADGAKLRAHCRLRWTSLAEPINEGSSP